MKKWTPFFFENSRIPILLSFFAPISIGAITLGIVVFSKGEMDETTKRHETIHMQQFLETFFIGFVLLYLWDYLFNRLRGLPGGASYRLIRAEIEAYDNEDDENYLQNRKRWKWLSSS